MRFSTRKDIHVMNLFKSKGINNIEHLSIENVSRAFSAHIEYRTHPSMCNYEDDFAIIYLNKNQSLQNIRKDFFHELGHYVQDYGDQRKMSQISKQYQESRSYWFTLYASMPRHIFEPMMLKTKCMQTLAELFELPIELITARIGTIRRARERSAYQNKLLAQKSMLHSKSLQPDKVYDSTITILKQLASQVGEEELNHEIRRLLRRY